LRDPALITQYKNWMVKYPADSNIPFAIGGALNGKELPEAKEFLLKVVELDPKNAKAWFMLALDAERWGQKQLSKEYMVKAAEAAPGDASYAFYAMSVSKDLDPDNYPQKVMDFTKRFPASERGAQALYWLAFDSKTLNDKIKYFEELKRLYPPQKFNWSGFGMTELWVAYLETDPNKAMALVNEVGTADKSWKSMKAVTDSILKERKMADVQNFKGAIQLLSQTKSPRYPNVSDFLYQEQASLLDKSGNARAAYDTLAAKSAKMPTDQLLSAVELYGDKLGKNKEQVLADVKTIRESTAVIARPFELGLYTSDGKLNLNDLKGKVVLLTFWFPGCGPCRGEFPHFQEVINEYKVQDVVYIGINVAPEQNEYVLPFMKNTKYSFIPLRGTDSVVKDYNVQGEPTNFLIDKDGKIAYTDFSIDANNQRTLELMISSLLN
ncbi:MAG TPA: redoxin domain-containing protein, partial [Puia sp.]|nr:redoxin domain-containing protein [Puia sp.]